MTQEAIREIIRRQREFFYTGATLNIDFRIEALKKLQASIQAHQEQIDAALKADLGKSSFESYMCESGLVLSEITYLLKHIRSLSREKTVHTPLAQFHSRSFQKPSPYGVSLIMSPWNYPFLLTFDPLADALAAGNTAVLKPSAYSPATGAVICEIVRECFPEHHVAVVMGGRAENACLLQEHFDYIFFTGSQSVGKEVMRKASEHLTPVTLELGGKSPCIIDKSANLKLAAKRIVFGKYLNCGQTCVAPDYVYCHSEVKDKFLEQIRKQIRKQFGKAPLDNKNYGKIINQKHFDRIQGLIDSSKVICGGNVRPKTLQIEPTVMDKVTFEDAVMQEEIFGPVLPILVVENMDEAQRFVQNREKPLACYIFTSSRKTRRKFVCYTSFGGGCVNDTVMHLTTPELPFGGVGNSGMGAYHGKRSFETFSHQKSILDKSQIVDIPVRYQPYRMWKKAVIRLIGTK